MPIALAPQCCDADGYLILGRACAESLSRCWHPLRPIGAQLYFSLPFRLGAGKEWFVVMNAALVVVSIACTAFASAALLPNSTRAWKAVLLVGSALVHAFFLGGMIFVSLSDLPSAVCVLVSTSALIAGAARNDRRLFLVSGAALGLATIVRAFYLYPALAAVAFVCAFSVRRRDTRRQGVLFTLAFLVPVAIQVSATRAHTSSWSFIDEALVAQEGKLHFETITYGYDTLLPFIGHRYDAPECFRNSTGMADAVHKGHWRDALCLVADRQWFYFGSYTSYGKVYLSQAEERRFSISFLVANLIAVLAAAVCVLRQARRRPILFAPVVLFGAIWAEGSAIIPEARFMVAFQVAVWTFAFAALIEALTRGRLPTRAEDPREQTQLIPAHLWAYLTPLRRKEVLLPALAVVATLVVHGMAIGSDFADEDLRHLFESQKFELIPYLVRPYGGHFCAFFRLSAALLHFIFGVHAWGYYGVMLVTHALNVLFLYGIVRAFTKSVDVAAIAAALWGAAPAFQGSLQWFAAYSHMLGVTALLWALWELARAAEAHRAPTRWALVRMNLMILAGAGTELTGSLTAVLMPLVALLLLPERSARLRAARGLLPGAALSLFVVLHFTGHSNANVVAFFNFRAVATTFVESLIYGVGVIVLAPFVTLNARDETWLLHGTTTWALWVSAFAAIPLLGLIAFRTLKGDPAERRVLLAMVGLSAALYGAVAVGRSWLTFGNPFSWVATRDRYHYDASGPLVVALALALTNTFPEARWARGRLAVVFGALSAGWVALGLFEARGTYLWGGGRQEWIHDYNELVDDSIKLMIARVPKSGVLYVRNDLYRPGGPIYAMGARQADLPGVASYWITAHGVGTADDRTIRFVELAPDTLRELRAESRPSVAEMFVSPDDVSKAGGTMRAIPGSVPPDVADYIEHSPDATVAPNDHARARRLLEELRLAESRPPTPWGAAPMLPSLDYGRGLFQEWLAADPDSRDALRARIDADPSAREALQMAILADPTGQDKFRRVLESDPKAMAAFQRSIQVDSRSREEFAKGKAAEAARQGKGEGAKHPPPAGP